MLIETGRQSCESAGTAAMMDLTLSYKFASVFPYWEFSLTFLGASGMFP